MKLVRNVVTGFEFAWTPDLERFSANPQNNLEVIEVEDGPIESVKPNSHGDGSTDPQTPPPGKKSSEDLKQNDTSSLPLIDTPDDGFELPPNH